MKSRVAIPLIVAICLGSPAMASSPEEQMVKGRGARDRSSGDGGGSARGGGERSGAASAPRGGGERTAGQRQDNDGDRRSAARSPARDRDGSRADDGRRTAAVAEAQPERETRSADDQRVAVRRAPDRDRGRSNGPVIVRQQRPININIGSSYRTRYYAPYYYDRWARNYYRWSPLGYAPWGLIYGSIGFSNYGYYGMYGSPYPYQPYGYYNGPWQASGYDIGGVRLKIRPRDAQVFVDGYYAGLVDDFDGTFQSLRLEQGGHKIEIHMPGYEDLELDVHVQPGRTITLAEAMRARP
jgi:hypothetical protein